MSITIAHSAEKVIADAARVAEYTCRIDLYVLPILYWRNSTTAYVISKKIVSSNCAKILVYYTKQIDFDGETGRSSLYAILRVREQMHANVQPRGLDRSH